MNAVSINRGLVTDGDIKLPSKTNSTNAVISKEEIKWAIIPVENVSITREKTQYATPKNRVGESAICRQFAGVLY